MVDYYFQEINTVTFDKEIEYVVYGFGMAGEAIAWYMINIAQIPRICFCDNNIEKHNADVVPPVFSVEETKKLLAPWYVVGFMKNDEEKIRSVIASLSEIGVNDKIILVDMSETQYRKLQDVYLENCYEKMLKKRTEKKIICAVRKIVFLSKRFTEEREKRGEGGPIGAICMQKKYLKRNHMTYALEYPYNTIPIEKNDLGSRMNFLEESFFSIKAIVDKEPATTVYIANEIYSAFALYILGKHYCLIYHAQGDIVQEISFFGKNYTDKQKKLLYKIEKLAFEGAHKVYFPSYGASVFFDISYPGIIKYTRGEPLYNTIYDFPKKKKIQEIDKKEGVITFLSIGQMTRLKGIDQIPEFIRNYVEKTNNKVRWIVVADGILKEEINKKMNMLIKKYASKIEYINIDYRISHAEIFYLMDICDIYIMLHRVSIFDFSTLEAMYHGKAIVLSDIEGNKEYNVNENILLIKVDEIDNERLCEYISRRKYYGNLNRVAYEKYFSEKPFVERYVNMIDDFTFAVIER